MKDKAAVVVAVVVTMLYVIFVVVLWEQVDDAEAAWNRRLLLFGGLEAIVFAAIGWLFGKEVHRAEAEKSTQNAKEAGEARGKGEALADAIRSTTTSGDGDELAVAQSGTSLRDLADRLFPPTL